MKISNYGAVGALSAAVSPAVASVLADRLVGALSLGLIFEFTSLASLALLLSDLLFWDEEGDSRVEVVLLVVEEELLFPPCPVLLACSSLAPTFRLVEEEELLLDSR